MRETIPMGGCVGSHHDSSGSLNENSEGTGGKNKLKKDLVRSVLLSRLLFDVVLSAAAGNTVAPSRPIRTRTVSHYSSESLSLFKLLVGSL